MTIEEARFTEMGAIEPTFVLLRLRPIENEQFGIMDSRYGHLVNRHDRRLYGRPI